VADGAESVGAVADDRQDPSQELVDCWLASLPRSGLRCWFHRLANIRATASRCNPQRRQLD
jgi:hypothetical protein